MVWVDGVGGFLVLARSPWLIGGPAAEHDGVICVQAALRRREAELSRTGSDYSLRRLKQQNGADGEASERFKASARSERPLRRHDAFRLGDGVHFEFCCPHPLSTSARLTVEPRFRFCPHTDAVLMLADTLLIGAPRNCHIVAAHANQTSVLFRRGDDWLCKAMGTGAGVDRGAERVEPGQRTEFGGVSFTVEPA